MAYTPATKIPQLNFFQWSTPGAPNPRLASGIDPDDTTLTFTSAPTDYLGAVVDGNFLMNVTNQSGFTELIYVPTGEMSVDGLTATNVIRGVRISGLDYTTGDTDFADIHEGDSVVGCAINAIYDAIISGIFTGTIATNGVTLRIGTEVDATTTIVAAGTTDRGFLRRNSSTSKAQFSNDGVTWTNFDSVSASNLVQVSAADTTPGYLSDKLVSATGGVDFTILNPAGDEKLNLIVDLTEVDIVAGPLANIVSDVTATATEINTALAGSSVTSGQLATLTGGPASNADALHTHTGLGIASLTAGENIDGSTTPQATFISKGTSASDAFPLQVQETENDTDFDVYGVNVAAQTFTTGAFQTKITRFDLMLMRVGAAIGNLVVNIYAVDGSSKPTGAVLGTATIADSTVVTTYLDWKTFSITMDCTPSTEYAIRLTLTAGLVAQYTEWQTGNGDTYPNGQAWTSIDSGATWSSLANDFAFRVWGYEAQTAGRLYKSDSDEPFRGGFDGFVTSNTLSGASATFRGEGIQTSFTGLTAGAPYYVDSTLGGITLTPGGLNIGKAISTTAIQLDFSESFVEKSLITTPTLNGGTTSTPLTYQVLGNCGFKPSRVKLAIGLDANGTGVTDTYYGMFNGEYTIPTPSLRGTATKLRRDQVAGTTPGAVEIVSGSSYAVINVAGDQTVTAGSFTLTNTGLTFTISENAANRNGTGYVLATYYR